MKKCIRFVFLLIFIFAFQSRIYAALECNYSDGKLTSTFTIENAKKVSKAIINGTLNSSDETSIKDEYQSIENWNSIFNPAKINAVGKDYFENYKKCPPYSIFVDRTGQFDYAVFTESHYKEFEAYGKSKQGYAIMELINSKDNTVKDPSSSNYEAASCWEYTKESCEKNKTLSCVWVEDSSASGGGYCNTDNLKYVSCGNSYDIPYQLPALTSFAINFLKIATPIILIIVSIIKLLKALSASKDDEIKKAQNSLIKKLIAAVLVFFVISIVQFVILKVADTTEQQNITKCMNCMLNNECEGSIYYKTNIGGNNLCRYLNGSIKSDCK